MAYLPNQVDRCRSFIISPTRSTKRQIGFGLLGRGEGLCSFGWKGRLEIPQRERGERLLSHCVCVRVCVLTLPTNCVWGASPFVCLESLQQSDDEFSISRARLTLKGGDESLLMARCLQKQTPGGVARSSIHRHPHRLHVCVHVVQERERI